jgi:hypothetical protein
MVNPHRQPLPTLFYQPPILNQPPETAHPRYKAAVVKSKKGRLIRAAINKLKKA